METTQVATGQFITFRLGDELFAIDVSQVREVLELVPVTRVPAAPPYLRGVVNVRGRAIPVADLRTKFGLPSTEDTHQTRIVVMDIELDGESTVVGGIADSVDDVIELDDTAITPPPRIAMRWRTDLIRGMGRRGDQFIIILDIQRVFADEGPLLAELAPVAPAS